MDIKTLTETLEIIEKVKSLFIEQNPYLPIYAALGGAFVGAVSTLIPSIIINMQNIRKERRATALQIYAEVKSYLTVIEHRQYIADLEKIVERLTANPNSTCSYQIQINDERFFIFKNCISKLGLLQPSIQVKIVEFYQFLEAIIQDVKPGGILNASPGGLYDFQQALNIAKLVKATGEEITQQIATDYKIRI